MSYIVDQTVEFLHIPKTAGCWIEHICKPFIRPAGTNHDFGRHCTNRKGDLPSFAVARDPYSWMKSCVGYTQKRWIIVEKNYPGWFLQCPYRNIGQLKSLRKRNAHINDVLKEYLNKMPGEYTKASMHWYIHADRLVKFDHLPDDFFAYLRALKVPHAGSIERKGRATEPMNTSKEKQKWSDVDTGLITALREAEHGWYEYTGRKA